MLYPFTTTLKVTKMKQSEIRQKAADALFESLTDDLAKDLQPEVKKIENRKIKSTQNNYGDYLRFMACGTDRAAWMIIGRALVKAGANVSGVNAALKIQLGH